MIERTMKKRLYGRTFAKIVNTPQTRQGAILAVQASQASTPKKEAHYADPAFQTAPSIHAIPFPCFLTSYNSSLPMPSTSSSNGGARVFDGMQVKIGNGEPKKQSYEAAVAQATLLNILRAKNASAASDEPKITAPLSRSKSDVGATSHNLHETKQVKLAKNMRSYKNRSNSDDGTCFMNKNVNEETKKNDNCHNKLVLFDMEGTIGSMNRNRFKARPGIQELAGLKAKGYRVGLYTNKAARNLPRKDIEALAGISFDVILTGDDCKQATESYCKLHGIEKYSKIKSLAKIGKLCDLLLVDDTPGKVEPHERHRVVAIKTWNPAEEDSELKVVVQDILTNWNDRVWSSSSPEISSSITNDALCGENRDARDILAEPVVEVISSSAGKSDQTLKPILLLRSTYGVKTVSLDEKNNIRKW